jgi:hypothetical protein
MTRCVGGSQFGLIQTVANSSFNSYSYITPHDVNIPEFNLKPSPGRGYVLKRKLPGSPEVERSSSPSPGPVTPPAKSSPETNSGTHSTESITPACPSTQSPSPKISPDSITGPENFTENTSLTNPGVEAITESVGLENTNPKDTTAHTSPREFEN